MQLEDVCLQILNTKGQRMTMKRNRGPSIKYVTLFWTNFDPSPVTHCHTSRDPLLKYVTHLGTPNFLVVGPCLYREVCLSSWGFLSGCFVRGYFVWKFLFGVVFVRSPLCQNIIRYNRKLNINFNFRFHMYETNLWRHMLLDPSPCHKLSHLLGPPPLERDVLYERPLVGEGRTECWVTGKSS